MGGDVDGDSMEARVPKLASIVYGVRRAGLVIAGLACPIGAIPLVWLLVRPEMLAVVGTPMLAAIVGLLVLPGLTMLALRLDKRVGQIALGASPPAAAPARATVVRHVTSRRPPPMPSRRAEPVRTLAPRR